ncbi:DUF1616 domain-containing protein [Oscillochloris sp. ZM17-4]|uniref:DUF1616 domain-containing protein n=1 Tax=Oscillochloris sp. ZM17-4 TaxID=2866714 RepID=UPI001C73B5C5|nr:DUF1616 domain-containing protein [Oscillochloris sp. ZM17-4]
MPRKSIDLLLVIALAAVGAAVALAPGLPTLLRAPFTITLTLALPGYALLAALDPGREIGGIELLVLRLGSSMVIVILGGLLLNLTPWGLRNDLWAALLMTVTMVAAGVALARRRLAAEERGSAERAAHRPALRLRPIQLALLALAALLLANAVGTARSGALTQHTTGFTQLWMLEVSGAAPGTVRLGVSNQELRPMSYVLRLTEGGRVLNEWADLELQAGAQWEITEVLPIADQQKRPVEASLYVADDPNTIYRHTVLWPGTDDISQ